MIIVLSAKYFTVIVDLNALQLLVGLVRWACEVAVEVMLQYNRFMLLVTHQ